MENNLTNDNMETEYRFIVIFRGRKKGVFNLQWESIKCFVEGYKNSYYKWYRDWKAASTEWTIWKMEMPYEKDEKGVPQNANDRKSLHN
jgi:hypothetical protein